MDPVDDRCSSASSASQGENSDTFSEGKALPKKPKYACTFQQCSSYPWAKVSREGPPYALCTLVLRIGGYKNLKRHKLTNLRKSSKQKC